VTTDCAPAQGDRGHPLLAESLRLFFPAAALHAIVSMLAWVAFVGLGLTFTQSIPAHQWHAHEMIFGTYGAALAGFLGSAVPEWTDTRPPQGRKLLMMMGLWLPGRLIGLAGLDSLVALATLTDAAFLAVLLGHVVSALVRRGSPRNATFAIWLALFLLIEIGVHAAWLAGAFGVSDRLLRAGLMVFLVFLSLAVARINVVVLNLALDPSGESTPYRPHPGRQNLTAILVSLYAVAALAFPASNVPAYLALAAAAAFFDRLAEWFVGAAVLRTHVAGLATANALAGIGFCMIGLAELGAPVAAKTGVHVLAIGSLGVAVLDVFVIAGLRHTGRDLDLPVHAHAAVALVLVATAVRCLPELGIGASLLGAHYGLSGLVWSAAFAVWLAGFLPMLLHPSVQQRESR
jgi:uncharacterized protein involved in response to NO